MYNTYIIRGGERWVVQYLLFAKVDRGGLYNTYIIRGGERWVVQYLLFAKVDRGALYNTCSLLRWTEVGCTIPIL